MERLHLLIQGRVQGVYFRASTFEVGEQLGVVGFVRNLPDGRVEVLAEGTGEQLEALERFCRKGPPGARVDHVEVSRGAGRGDLGERFYVAR